MTSIPDTAELVVRASHVPGPPQGKWTYADYAQLPEAEGFRYEVIDGVLYIAPAPTTLHEFVNAIIIARLVAAVYDADLGMVYTSPDIDIGTTTVRPDAVVVLKHHAGVVIQSRIVGPPDLVVEIASPSTAAYDRNRVEGKWAAYERMGIAEYWIIDPIGRSIEVITLENDRYRSLGVVRGDELLPSQVLPGLATPAHRFFPRGG